MQTNSVNPTRGGARSLSRLTVQPLVVLLLVALSWAGAFYHTWTELRLGPIQPENSLPAVIGVLFFLGWWRRPEGRRRWSWALLIWTVGGHLLSGAMLSVLPLPIWPFSPEQTWGHYRSHVIYGLAQLPLIFAMWRSLSRELS